MNTPVLTMPERTNIESGSWFSRLSLPLRNAILSRAVVRRLNDGAMLSARGQPAEEWCGVAKGAVRVSSVSLSGKQITLTYVEPGVWFGDISLFDGLPRTHDSNAHGAIVTAPSCYILTRAAPEGTQCRTEFVPVARRSAGPSRDAIAGGHGES